MQHDYVPALRFKVFTRFYDPVVRFTTRERVVKQALIRNATVPKDATVVDIGCGTGTLTIWLKQQYPDARVIGVDADPEILAFARNKASVAAADVEFVESNATDLPFNDGSAERVVSSLFFHHLQPADKGRALTEALRILCGGGELHVSDWGAPANIVMR
ncbi:MAG: methyltransferase domain-containing protein, partial [Desulfobulbaceae bacterium]|nr:methyltransferase domain-containing protein [Desulfobulbaceae bacterium]